MTASSLASVSLQPRLVSVCVEHTAEMHRAMKGVQRYVLNILHDGQEELSRRFAMRPPDNRFLGVPYRETADGLIVLQETLAYVECDLYAQYSLGDHTLFVGRITGGETSERAPLLYFRGDYAGLCRP